MLRIRAIYAADDAFRRLPPAERKLMLRPLLESFFDWVRQVRAIITGRSLITSALTYAFNQEKELLRVLDDGRLPLDNTRSERSLRRIVASSRLHSLDPEQYLEEVMRVLPYWPDSRYLELAPNHWAATRAKLLPAELEAPFDAFTVPQRDPGQVGLQRSARAERWGR